MPNPWLVELRRLAVLAVLFLGLGLAIGDLSLGLLTLVTVYLGWHLYNLRRLVYWLTEGRKLQPPDAPGIWGEVYDRLYLLQRRNRSRKRKLKSYLKQFRESTSAAPDTTVVLGKRGEIEWWNNAAAKTLGLRSPQDVGQRIVNLLRHPAFTGFFLKGDYSGSVEFPSPVDPGLLLSVRVVPYGNSKRLVVARDVTRLHRLEQTRRDFVANVSHELRTPLTVISGFLETMCDAPEDELTRRWGRSLTLMRQQTLRMQRIVEDLLLLSRLELDTAGFERKPVAVGRVITEIRNEALALSGERRHTLVLEVDETLDLRGNEKELRSAFSNLVFNAVQYTPEQGRITVCWYADEAGAHFAVTDTGEGIAPHHIPRLTERFYRVDTGRSRERGGTGLGLAIVKHVLTRHDAVLRIESELGKGSTFSCDFPPATIAGEDAPEHTAQNGQE